MAQYTNALTKVFFLPFLIPDPQFHTINCPHPAYSILFYSILQKTLKFPITDLKTQNCFMPQGQEVRG